MGRFYSKFVSGVRLGQACGVLTATMSVAQNNGETEDNLLSCAESY